MVKIWPQLYGPASHHLVSELVAIKFMRLVVLGVD